MTKLYEVDTSTIVRHTMLISANSAQEAKDKARIGDCLDSWPNDTAERIKISGCRISKEDWSEPTFRVTHV